MGRRKYERTPEQEHWLLRRKTLERILKNYATWRALYETEGEAVSVISAHGDEWHIFDVLDGLDELPPRQLEAIVLTCLEGRSELEAAKIMGFKKWSTPVQQYRNLGLNKLLAMHDKKSQAQKKREEA